MVLLLKGNFKVTISKENILNYYYIFFICWHGILHNVNKSNNFSNQIFVIKCVIFREPVEMLVSAEIIVYFQRRLNMFKQRMLFYLKG